MKLTEYVRHEIPRQSGRRTLQRMEELRQNQQDRILEILRHGPKKPGEMLFEGVSEYGFHLAMKTLLEKGLIEAEVEMVPRRTGRYKLVAGLVKEGMA